MIVKYFVSEVWSRILTLFKLSLNAFVMVLLSYFDG